MPHGLWQIFGGAPAIFARVETTLEMTGFLPEFAHGMTAEGIDIECAG